ncbi:hypothetical protein K7432_016367 [Basidiobolus ranarum]
MDVKRGHRRLLQREIASLRGLTQPPSLGLSLMPNDDTFLNISDPGSTPIQPRLLTPGALPSHNISHNGISLHGHHLMSLDTGEYTNSDGNGKRKYRRHPKPDKNAPEKPASAYVMFSNKVRAELKDQNMSFTEIAKIVGDRWKSISREEKDQVEQSAAQAREGYYEALRSYKETNEYKEYQDYLAEFRRKSGSCVRPVGRPRKHPKPHDEMESSVSDLSSQDKHDIPSSYELSMAHSHAVHHPHNGHTHHTQPNNHHPDINLEFVVNQPDQTFMI